LNPQIQALGATDEACDEENTTQLSKKGQEDWQMNLATMSSQFPSATKKKGIATSRHTSPPPHLAWNANIRGSQQESNTKEQT